MDLDILYEDNHVIVVYKPQGILSQGDISGDISMLDMVRDYIKEKYNKPGNVYVGLVHRLDRNTSGVMVFAKTSKAASRLQQGLIKKEYLAVVEGMVENKEYITLKNNLYYDESKKKSFIKTSGKEAILEYKMLDIKDNMSLISVILKTGRHHQIRCQMANIDHPIVGDLKYNSKYKRGNFYALCAYKLTFIHPTLKTNMEFKCIKPCEDFLKFEDVLKKMV